MADEEQQQIETNDYHDQVPVSHSLSNSDDENDEHQTSAKKPGKPKVSSDTSYGDDEPDLLEKLFEIEEKRELIDRLLGCAYGQALGDAYGLATEFEDRGLVERNYPEKSKVIPFPNYVGTWHNNRWRRGDWTDDTDQWILILETLVEKDGDVKVFAKKLSKWISCGFQELGDYGGMGLGANVSQVVRSYGYLDDPLTISQNVWEKGGRQAAPNGALMRCSSCAFIHYNDHDQLKSKTIDLCKTTHCDPRCIASCLAVCLTVSYLIRKEFDNDDIEKLVERVQNETIEILGESFTEEDKKTFLWFTAPRTLAELDLDEPGKIGYTYKCLASGFYGLRSTDPFDKTLDALIRYGGDADTNGAVCGTMFGARYGYRQLPYNWLKEMPFKKWFDKKIIGALKHIHVIEETDRFNPADDSVEQAQG